jgi:hypothetical protein
MMFEAQLHEAPQLIEAQKAAAGGEDAVGPQAVMIAEQESSRDRNACPHRVRAQKAFERSEGTDHRLPRRLR